MSYLAVRLAVAELRIRRSAAAALAVAIGIAGLLPSLVARGGAERPVAATGLLLAAGIVFASVSGAQALGAHRDLVLERSGAPRRTPYVVAMASVAGPAAVATSVVLALRPLVTPTPRIDAVILTCLVVPLAGAPISVWIAGQAAAPGRPDRPVDVGSTLPRQIQRGLLAAIGVLVVLLLWPVALVLGPFLVMIVGPFRTVVRPAGASGWRSGLATVLSLVVLGVATVVVGGSATWFDAFVTLIAALPAAAVAVAVLGVVTTDLLAGLAGRIGGVVHLALAPVHLRRAVVAPMIGVVVILTWLSVTDGVVGASFGERERRHVEAEGPARTLPAGDRADEAIVSVPLVEPQALRAVLAGQPPLAGGRAVVVEQVGFGFRDAGVASLLSSESTVRLPDPAPPGRRASPDWIGVVEPSDLAALGWATAADDLAAGRIVVFGASAEGLGTEVDVITPAGPVRLPVATVAGLTGGARLPGALVSGAVAAELSPVRTVGRVVVVAAEPTSPTLLERAGGQAELTALGLPDASPSGLGRDQARFDREQTVRRFVDRSVVLGGDAIVAERVGGPLNAMPLLSGTAASGRRRLAMVAVLPVLMTVAAVVLGLTATRRERSVLDVQGAPPRLRSAVAGLQGAVVGASASLVAGLFGIGMPAAAFAIYGRGTDLPPIPLVVPGSVVALLVAIPLVSATLAAVGVAVEAGPEADLVDPDLVW